MINKKCKTITLVFTILISSYHLLGQGIEIDEARIKRICSYYQATIPGAAIAFVKDDKVVFTKSFGLSNMEKNMAIDSNTVFYIGNLSEHFTAFSIFLLEKEGKLKFDDDVRKYIPELPPYEKKITIRHLLSHTSGLKDVTSIAFLLGMEEDEYYDTPKALEIIFRQKALQFDPGSKHQFSYSGYILLSEIVKRVSHQKFEDFVTERIFKPLNMMHSSFATNAFFQGKDRTISYKYKKSTFNATHPKKRLLGSTGILTNVTDFAKWVNNFHKPIVGDSILWRKFLSPNTLESGEEIIYPGPLNTKIMNGLYGVKYMGREAIINIGMEDGSQYFFAHYSENNFSVIVLSNNESIPCSMYGWKLAEIALPDFFELPVYNEQEVQEIAEAPGVERIENEKAEAISGIYQNTDLPCTFTVKVENHTLKLYHDKIRPLSFSYNGGDQFSYGDSWELPYKIKFMRDQTGKVIEMDFEAYFENHFIFKKIQ